MEGRKEDEGAEEGDRREAEEREGGKKQPHCNRKEKRK